MYLSCIPSLPLAVTVPQGLLGFDDLDSSEGVLVKYFDVLLLTWQKKKKHNTFLTDNTC